MSNHSEEMSQLYNTDKHYCLSQVCIHRRGCRHSLENYTDKEVKDIYTKSRFVNEIDFTKCIPNYKDKKCENGFDLLDRFRLSTGQEFEICKTCSQDSLVCGYRPRHRKCVDIEDKVYKNLD